MKPIVSCKGVKKRYRQGDVDVEALRGVDLAIEAGELVSLSGPSGSGKSTLLNLVGALDHPSGGEIRVDDRSLAELGKGELADLRLHRIGFVFQAYNLIPVLSARENVEFILQLLGVEARERRERAEDMLEQVGLAGLGERRPARLSGGQQQRVAVARALASRPAIVLADEPSANLDSESTASLVDLMAELNERSRVTFLIATHDERVIRRTRRHIVLRDGRIDSDRPFVPAAGAA